MTILKPYFTKCTAQDNVKRYWDIDTGKLIRNKLHSIKAENLGCFSNIEYGNNGHGFYFSHKWKDMEVCEKGRIVKWFVPKDNDWED